MFGPLLAEYRRVLGEMAQERADALIVSDHANHFTHRRLIIDLAEKVRLPGRGGLPKDDREAARLYIAHELGT